MKITFKESIGHGMFGDIWAGDDEIGRNVAIKVIRESGEGVSTILQHAQALVRAKHTNVVDVYSIEYLVLPDSEKGTKCIVMEHIDGVSLRKRIEKKLTAKEAFNIGEQILAGIKHIHSQGLVHMDLHEENVMVKQDDTVKIIDILYMNSMSELAPNAQKQRLDYDIRQLDCILSSLIYNSELGIVGYDELRKMLGKPESIAKLERSFLDLFTNVASDLDSITDLFGLDPLKLRSYKFKSECEHDVDSLRQLLGREMVSISKTIKIFPDTEVEIVTTLELEALRDKMRQVEDGHVMVQTLLHKADYTGERNFDIW
ncbi:protein kinase domain-containing protein [Nostoc sp. UHCC 0252]|uniref:protein kinase domain-containing protein n=1 Tax=Nostoc sp. UHCC 0252 TaxID=3110241 RepID=UPI002B21DD1D|nr:protein kinase [Nostoc sp. UHCC 0252]MEA5600069.1 protein kinase [Nostoc sp. UHCC 0252]